MFPTINIQSGKTINKPICNGVLEYSGIFLSTPNMIILKENKMVAGIIPQNSIFLMVLLIKRETPNTTYNTPIISASGFCIKIINIVKIAPIIMFKIPKLDVSNFSLFIKSLQIVKLKFISN